MSGKVTCEIGTLRDISGEKGFDFIERRRFEDSVHSGDGFGERVRRRIGLVDGRLWPTFRSEIGGRPSTSLRPFWRGCRSRQGRQGCREGQVGIRLSSTFCFIPNPGRRGLNLFAETKKRFARRGIWLVARRNRIYRDDRRRRLVFGRTATLNRHQSLQRVNRA